MQAWTVIPGRQGSARISSMPEPPASDGAILLEALALGVCGTDREIVGGLYGAAPPGEDRLILGHESLGRVVEAPPGSGLAPGDLAVGIVRRPDPVPCRNCAAGEWDMCRNGRFTERGIKERHGFGSERFRLEPEFTIRIDPALEHTGVLLEPASVIAKAWEHIDYIGARAVWAPERLLVTGAGPIGLLAALMGVQRGLETHVLDRVTDGFKPQLVGDLGATYHCGTIAEACSGADIIIECTGVGRLAFEAMLNTRHGGIACLTGISSGGRSIRIDAGELNRELVLENDLVFGTVNANRRHYLQAAEALARADQDWLSRLITRREPLSRWEYAINKSPQDVKAIIDFKR